MRKQIYNWTRYWSPFGVDIKLSIDGFLPEPAHEFWKYTNPEIRSLEELQNIPCLVLLGDPGMGKSTAYVQEIDRLTKVESEINLQIISVDMKLITSGSAWNEQVFQTEVYRHWEQDDGKLYLFIDSVDECTFDSALLILLKNLKEVKSIERLFLRIVSRGADWQTWYTDRLKEFWGKEKLETRILAPLRKKDICEAARAERIDAEEFISAIHNREIQPLAMKPVTLRMLFDVWEESGALAESTTGLYRRGCLHLCRELNKRRRATGIANKLSPEERLLLAERIAAYMLVGNWRSVYLDVNNSSSNDQRILGIVDLIGDSEKVDNICAAAEIRNIQETLSTALFGSAPQDRIEWHHQTYIEFLCACYLHRRNLPLKRLIQVLSHPEDPRSRPVRQLRSVASWLISLKNDPNYLLYLLKAEPEALFQADLASLSGAQMYAVVDSILQGYNRNEILDRDWIVYSQYHKLNHSDLAKQLIGWIQDPTNNAISKGEAIHIAKTCEVSEITNTLIQIAYDPDEPARNRKRCVHVVGKIGADEARFQLLPMLESNFEDDVDDELRAELLRALWPNFLTPSDVFSLLTEPKTPNYLGNFHSFQTRYFSEGLAKNDICESLDLLMQPRPPSAPWSDPFARLSEQVLRKAYQHIEDKEILDTLAHVLLELLRSHFRFTNSQLNDKSLQKAIEENPLSRKTLLKALLESAHDAEKDPDAIRHGGLQLVSIDDLDLLLTLLNSDFDMNSKGVIAKLLTHLNLPSEKYLDLWWNDKSGILRNQFDNWFLPVELDSEDANRARESHHKWKEYERHDQEWKLKQEIQKNEIENLFSMYISKAEMNWVEFLKLYEVIIEIRDNRHEIIIDVNLLKEVEEIDDDVQMRIVMAAKRFIESETHRVNEYIETQHIDPYSTTGYSAFRLVGATDPTELQRLPDSVWNQWAAGIVYCRWIPQEKWDELDDLILTLAYEKHPADCIDTIKRLIVQDGNADVDYRIRALWDTRLEEAVIAAAKKRELKSEIRSKLLVQLFKRDIHDAEKLLTKEFKKAFSNDAGSHDSLLYARTLVNDAPDAGWSILWPIIAREDEFAMFLVTSFAEYEVRIPGFDCGLSAEEIENLYFRLVELFPYAEDVHTLEMHSRESREKIQNWRESILQVLLNSHRSDALEVLFRIRDRYSKHIWLQRVCKTAEVERFNATWIPLDLQAFRSQIKNCNKIIIRNESEFLDAVTTSLHRLQERLSGKIPLSEFLWDEWKPSRKDILKRRPKTEQAVSNYLKQWLEMDLHKVGIFVVREPEIKRPTPTEPGQELDILVSALVKDERAGEQKQVSVYIEVKGCWHKKVKTALQDQLFNRYMKGGKEPCAGLYIVAWFNKKEWDRDDSRRVASPWKTPEEARKHLSKQATTLSPNRLNAYVLEVS